MVAWLQTWVNVPSAKGRSVAEAFSKATLPANSDAWPNEATALAMRTPLRSIPVARAPVFRCTQTTLVPLPQPTSRTWQLASMPAYSTISSLRRIPAVRNSSRMLESPEGSPSKTPPVDGSFGVPHRAIDHIFSIVVLFGFLLGKPMAGYHIQLLFSSEIFAQNLFLSAGSPLRPGKNGRGRPQRRNMLPSPAQKSATGSG